MRSTDSLHATLRDIYDVVADPMLWPSVLTQVASAAGATGCIVFEWRKTDGARHLSATVASENYEMASIARYIRECFPEEARDQDIFEAHSLRHDSIDLIDDSVLAPDIQALRERSNVIVLSKLGLFHRAAGLLDKDDTARARFSVQYAASRARPDPEERARLAFLLPHVAKAMDLCRPAAALAAADLGLLVAMDRLTIGMCLLDEAGRLVAENEEFRRQRTEYRAFQLTPSGSLAMSHSLAGSKLEHLRREAGRHGRFGARPRKETIATGQGGFLCIDVTPLERSGEIGSRAFGGTVLYSTDTSRPLACDATRLAAAFGLTRAEAEVVERIAAGETNARIAERRGRSVATVNAQVKAILAKTDCTNRTQLVRLMLSFGSGYLRDDPP